MEPVSLVLAVAPVIAGLYKLNKKIEKYQEGFKTRARELKALGHGIRTLSYFLVWIDRELRRLKGKAAPTEEELSCCNKIIKGANRLRKSIQRFLTSDKRKNQHRFGLWRDARAVRRWTAARPRLDLYRWEISSEKATLQLLICVLLQRSLDRRWKKAKAGLSTTDDIMHDLEEIMYGGFLAANSWRYLLTVKLGP